MITLCGEKTFFAESRQMNAASTDKVTLGYQVNDDRAILVRLELKHLYHQAAEISWIVAAVPSGILPKQDDLPWECEHTATMA